VLKEQKGSAVICMTVPVLTLYASDICRQFNCVGATSWPGHVAFVEFAPPVAVGMVDETVVDVADVVAAGVNRFDNADVVSGMVVEQPVCKRSNCDTR
jgi:hypothetical protein